VLSKDSNIFFVDISSLALKLAFYCIYRFVLSVSSDSTWSVIIKAPVNL
jgi:hypothetical protein